MQAKLRVIGGKTNKKEISLNLPSIVGRSREAGLTIAHPMVSRQHCELFEAGGLVRIRDLGSTNGTFVAGKKVAESVLRPRDQFSVGPLTFEVDYEYIGDATVAEDVAVTSRLDFAPPSSPASAAEADESVFQFLADEEPSPAEPPAAAAEPAAEEDFAPPAEEPAEFAVAGPEPGDFVPEPASTEEPEPWSEPPGEVPDLDLEPAPFAAEPEAVEPEAAEPAPPPSAMPSIDPAAETPAPAGIMPSIAPADGQMPDFSAWGAATTADPPQTVDAPPEFAPGRDMPWGPAAGAAQTISFQEAEGAGDSPWEATAPAEPDDQPAATSPPKAKPKKGGWWPFGKGKPTAKKGTGRSSSPYTPGFEASDGGAAPDPGATWQEESAPTPPTPTPPPPSPPARRNESPRQAAPGGEGDLDNFLEGLQ